MKANHIFKIQLAAALLLSTLNSQLSTVFAQGSLTPPGAPAPTMKSLDQIEARTPLDVTRTPGDSTDSFIISQPGSYFLTTNLVGVSGKNGIEIVTNNVTLDLNGFTLSGVSGSEDGIHIPGTQINITVRNGTISGWGNDGVNSKSLSSVNMVFERLNVSECSNNGIVRFGTGVVRDCNSENNAYEGIACYGGIISGCTVINNGDCGIIVSGTVSGCFVQYNVYCGIYVVAPGSAVIGNTCTGNDSVGIYIYGSHIRVEDNHVTFSGDAGIYVGSGTGNNIIIKNSVSGNGTNNYQYPSGQIVGPLITTTGTITNVNPWANFSF